MVTKSLSQLEIKDADKGQVAAVFSTFGVKDLDGDVTLPGAFEDGAKVRISAYNHESWGGALPVGKGVIRATKTEAVLDGSFFLETAAGRDTFATVKAMGDMQEWSFGYDVVGSSFGDHEGEKVRFLSGLKVHEVSPVLLGAGIDTRTLSVKSTDPVEIGRAVKDALKAAGPLTFSEEAADVLVGVSALLDGATRVVALRAEKGKPLSLVNAELLAQVESELKRLADLLRPEADTPPPEFEAMASEYARFLRLL